MLGHNRTSAVKVIYFILKPLTANARITLDNLRIKLGVVALGMFLCRVKLCLVIHKSNS